MLALVTVLGFLLEDNETLRGDIADSVLAQFPIIGDTISESVTNPLGGNTIALVFGLAAALWAGLGMMQVAQDSMNDLWTVARADQPNFLMKRVRSIAMLVLITVMLAASTALAQLAALVVSGVVATGLLLALTIAFDVAIFMVAYRLLTVAKLTWGQVLPGSCFGAAAYTSIQLLGSFYISRTLKGAADTYGTFATVIGLLSWIFLIAQVFMLGAEINAVKCRGLWPRSLFTDRDSRIEPAGASPHAGADRYVCRRARGEQLQKGEQVVGVLFLDGEDALHQAPRRDVLVAQPAGDLGVGLDRDAFGDQVLLDHVDQVGAGHVLGMAAARPAWPD